MAALKKEARQKRATIADVARLAGVGVMTVSRAINGHPYVSDAVGKRVQAAIRKLNYRPNLVAQMLNGRPSSTIGLIAPDLSDPFFSSLIHAVQQTAREHRYQVWVAATNSDPKVERSEIDEMKARAIEGILLVPAQSDAAHLRDGSFSCIPLVTVDRFLPKGIIDSVEVENEQGARTAVEHLIAHGRKKILCFGYDGRQPTIAARLKGYQSALKIAGLPALLYVASESTSPFVSDACAAIEKCRPDAVFTVNNVSTMRVLEALQRLRIRIPKQVSLIGFDDAELWQIVAPPITAVRQPVQEMGELAVKILIDRIRNKGKSAVRMQLPVRLVIRASCGCETASPAPCD